MELLIFAVPAACASIAHDRETPLQAVRTPGYLTSHSIPSSKSLLLSVDILLSRDSFANATGQIHDTATHDPLQRNPSCLVDPTLHRRVINRLQPTAHSLIALNAHKIVIRRKPSYAFLVDRQRRSVQDADPLVRVLGEPAFADEVAAPFAGGDTGGGTADYAGFAGDEGGEGREGQEEEGEGVHFCFGGWCWWVLARDWWQG